MEDLQEASGLENLVGVSKGGSSYRVCYSTHSSMEELEMFVTHFSPAQITPCAVPPGFTKEEVGSILASFLQAGQTASDTGSSHLSSSESPHQHIIAASPQQVDRMSGEVQVNDSQANTARDTAADSLSKICFHDTLDLNDDVIYEEDLGSDEEDLTAQHRVIYSSPSKNKSFSLALELSEDEDLFDSVPSRDDSVEIIEQDGLANICDDNDTPDIEDIIAEAELNDLPVTVIKTMREFKKRKDIVLVID